MNHAPLELVTMDHNWKALFESIDRGILLVSDDWNLEYANAQALIILDCQSTQDLAAVWRSRLKELAAMAFGSPRETPSHPLDFELPGTERPKKLKMKMVPLDPAHGLAVLLLQDPVQVEAAQGDLRLMGRYRSLARLYRTMGHDLKAPLNALTINLDLLKTSLTRFLPPDPIIGERQQRYLKVLEDEMNRLNRSLQTFLAQAVPPTQEANLPFNLRELLMELISLVAPQARQQQVAIDVQMDEQNMSLEGQRDLLKQALLNMAVNALEAMPDGGRLTIKLETRMGRAVILLLDTGTGIPSEMQEKIWDLHTTTKKTGTGIGLYVARSVIESFGGTVNVESRGGQGSCFTISLPLTHKEAS